MGHWIPVSNECFMHLQSISLWCSDVSAQKDYSCFYWVAAAVKLSLLYYLAQRIITTFWSPFVFVECTHIFSSRNLKLWSFLRSSSRSSDIIPQDEERQKYNPPVKTEFFFFSLSICDTRAVNNETVYLITPWINALLGQILTAVDQELSLSFCRLLCAALHLNVDIAFSASFSYPLSWDLALFCY